MNPKILLKEIMNDVKSLPEREVRSIAEYVRYIREKEMEERIINSRQLVSEVKKSRRSWKEKKRKDFTPWEEIKKKNDL